MWNLVLKNNMQIKAAHIMGKRNYLADLLSRKEIRSGEWVLKSSVVNSLFALWGQPMIDLFATQENKKAMLFCSWIPSQHAFALDALSVAWENMYAYAFPPIQLIHRVLCHMKQYQCTVILIAPCWPRQQWFPILLSLLIAKPVRLPCSPDLLSQSQGEVLHPEPETLNLMAWRLSTDTCQQRARQLLSASWQKGTKRDYNCKFRQFGSWCDSQKVDPLSPSLVDCAHFVTFLFEKGLKYKTITGYRSMLSSILPRVEGFPIGQHPHIIRLLKGIFNERPPLKKLVPEWDLCLVLGCLRKPPFEPLKDASLKHVTWKICFLVAITTFRRCSDLQSLQLGEKTVKVQKKGVTFIRTGMAKQDRTSHVSSNIFVPAFTNDKLLDPKRALT